MKKKWINDGKITCNSCGSISKSYFLEGDGETNHCPNCGSSDINPLEEE